MTRIARTAFKNNRENGFFSRGIYRFYLFIF